MLKVMTLNINFYGDKHGDWMARRELIRDEIEDLAPDIVALQAVRRDPTQFDGEDQASQLADMLDEYPHVAFRPAGSHDGVEDGTAFVSRIFFAGAEAYPLSRQPDLDDTNERTLLHGFFDTDDGPLDVFNGYFSWVTAQAQSNVEEALEVMQVVDGPALLLGDFNQPPGSHALQPLRDAGWTDVWAELRGMDGGHTYEAPQPDRRIDYVWANEALANRVTQIDRVIGESESGDVRLSDHYGLLVTIEN